MIPILQKSVRYELDFSSNTGDSVSLPVIFLAQAIYRGSTRFSYYLLLEDGTNLDLDDILTDDRVVYIQPLLPFKSLCGKYSGIPEPYSQVYMRESQFLKLAGLNSQELFNEEYLGHLL